MAHPIRSLTVGLVLLAAPVMAAPFEYFDHATFLADAGSLTVIGFDDLGPCDACVAGNQYAADGLTIVSAAGWINAVSNTVPGSYGGNFVTATNINSGPNAISASISTGSAGGAEDSFDFLFSNPGTSAGLWIGNMGGGFNELPWALMPTTVEFFDLLDNVIASEVLDVNHTGVIHGPGFSWDNRVFYGIVSDVAIAGVRVRNPTGDGDGIVIDDVQFSAVAEVPEPSTIALVAGGCVLLALRRRAL